MQMCWEHKAVCKEGLHTNAHRCWAQVVREKKTQSDSTRAKQEHPRNCATAQKLPPPKVKKNVVCDRTLMNHL